MPGVREVTIAPFPDCIALVCHHAVMMLIRNKNHDVLSRTRPRTSTYMLISVVCACMDILAYAVGRLSPVHSAAALQVMPEKQHQPLPASCTPRSSHL